MDAEPIMQAMRRLQCDCPNQAGLLDQEATRRATDTLDQKTGVLIGLAVAAALRQEGRVAQYVAFARAAGASRDEVICAILAGLPGAGGGVLEALPAALGAYDSVYRSGRD